MKQPYTSIKLRLIIILSCFFINIASIQIAHAIISSNDKKILKKINIDLKHHDFRNALRLKKKLSNIGAQKYIDWKYITHKKSVPNYSFIKNFITQNPNMPLQHIIRDKLENTLSNVSFNTQKKFFKNNIAVSTEGKIAEINFYFKNKQTQKATKLLKYFWHSQELSNGQLSKLLIKYQKYLTQSDHSKRISYLIDERHYIQAKSLLKYGTKSDTKKYNIRYKLQKRQRNALQNYFQTSKEIQQDGGVLRSLVYYYRKKNKELKAIDIMKNLTPHQGQDNPKAWYQSRNILSRVAFKHGKIKAAYYIIARHGLHSGSDYVTAEFYAGWLALRYFKQNKTALQHFKNGHRKSSMPISLSRFEYWIGRTCHSLNDRPCEKIAYTNASKYFYTFYGQLAAYHLRQNKIYLPKYPNPNETIKKAFLKDHVIQAAHAASAINNQSDIRILISSVAQRKNKHQAVLVLLEKISQKLGNLKTQVKVAKYASRNNDFLLQAGYPIIDLQKIGSIPEKSIIYALTRQESEFDQYARSHVGARGLMQIMPGTAKQLARQLKKKYRLSDLTRNAQYNMTLGGFYLNKLVKKFNGSYIHALSAYNAGPSRIPQWDKNYGMFRSNLFEIIDRIEMIPFSETRNYVQRILESTQIYRSKLNKRNYIQVNDLVNDLKRGIPYRYR